MEPNKAIDLLRKQCDEIKNVTAKEPWSTDYKKWRYFTERLITQLWGENSSQFKRFAAIFAPWPIAVSSGTPRGYHDEQRRERFLSVMNEASAIIDGIIEEIQTFGLAPGTQSANHEGLTENAQPVSKGGPYVFVSHGSKDTALVSAIKHAFLDLSIEPRFVEEKPAGAPPTRELAEAVRNSKAVFVFFTMNSILLETRDWIVFELGVAVANDIPIYCWKQTSLNKVQLPRLLEQVTTYRDFDIYNSNGTIRLTEEVRAAAKAL